MPLLSINQAVDVRSVPPAGEQISGVTEGEEHVHSFDNLIPACEFAVSLAGEGHSHIRLDAEQDGALELADAQRVVAIWHSGKTPLDAEEIEW